MTVIQIQDRARREWVDAELVLDVSLDERIEIEQNWGAMRREMASELTAVGLAIPANSDWDWSHKGLAADETTCQVFGVRYEDRMQGLMMIDLTPRRSRLHIEAARVLYIEYLEVAPNNQAHYSGRESRFGYVGRALLRSAVQASLEAGCDGMLALHSLEQAESFYRRESFTDLGIDIESGFRYFELNTAAAARLLE